MNRFGAIAIALSVALSSGAMAGPSMTQDVYTSEKERIKTEFKAQKERCDSFSGNAKDICLAEAKGNQDVAEAELAARHKPSKDSRYQANAAKINAEYEVAKEKCDDRAGNTKDICLKDAKAAEAAAKANAKKED
ncbi:MAG: hypothetical protein ABIV42_05390 [Nitrosospira sp.]